MPQLLIICTQLNSQTQGRPLEIVTIYLGDRWQAIRKQLLGIIGISQSGPGTHSSLFNLKK